MAIDIERRKERERLNYAWYRKHDVCVRCHKADAETEKAMCRRCLDYMLHARRKYMEKKQ